MIFDELIANRQSTRVFTAQPVAENDLQAALACLNVAPSAGNLQAYHVYVVHSERGRALLHEAAPRQYALNTAAAALVFCIDRQRAAQKYGERGASLFCVQDATIACTYVLLALAQRGIAAVWIGSFDEEGVTATVKAPAGITPVAILALGYAAETPARRPRRPLNEIVHVLEDA